MNHNANITLDKEADYTEVGDESADTNKYNVKQMYEITIW